MALGVGHMQSMPAPRSFTAAALTVALLLGTGSLGCAGSTTIEHVWRSPTWAGSFTHVVIFGMSKLPGVRRDFETRMVAALANVGVRATASHHLFPGDGELRDEDIARALAQYGVDGALVTRLVGVDRQSYYVDGNPYPFVGGVPLGFYGYYHGTYSVLYSPGYVADYPIVILETNLYDVATSELVWAGLSETFDPKNVDQAIESYAETMVGALVRSGMLTPVAMFGGVNGLAAFVDLRQCS